METEAKKKKKMVVSIYTGVSLSDTSFTCTYHFYLCHSNGLCCGENRF